MAALAQRYRRMILGGALLFVVLCGLTMWGGWVREYDAALSLAAQRVQKDAIRLSGILKAASDHVSQTARWAEDFPDHAPYPGPADLRQAARQALAQSVNGDINLDVLAKRSAEQRLGLLIATTEAAKARPNGAPSNLELALPLLDRFRYGQATTPFLRWSYFFSARKDLLAMAPWASSADVLGEEPTARSFLQHSWTYEITDRGRPENNPDRHPYWTKAYHDQAGAGLMVSYGVPVYWGEEFIGVMGADVLLSFLSDFLREFPDPDGLLLITNEHGEVLGDREGLVAKAADVMHMDEALPPPLRPWASGMIGASESGRLVNGWHVVSESTGDPRWTVVYLIPRSTLAWRVTKQFGPQLVLLVLLMVALAVMSRFLRQWYVAPALAVADFVAHEDGTSANPPPSVPEMWRPWLDAMARAFRERREYLAELRTEITDRKRAEESLRETTRMLERVNHILTVLSQANEELVRATDEPGLFSAMCGIIVETGGYRMAWVGIADGDGPIRPVAHAGHEDGFLAVAAEWSGGPLADGQLRVVGDLENADAPLPWRQAALARGYRSAIALPLRLDESRVGVLSVYAAEPDAFGSKEAALFVDLGHDLSYGVAVMRERQARIDMERILAHAQKMEALGRLAGGVAHDFNNLLGAILGFAHFIAEDSPSQSPLHYYASRIIAAGKRGKAVVSQILTFARKGEMEREPLDLGQLLDEVHTLAAASVPSTTRLVFENDLPGAVVVGDATGLTRMLLNLCVNAHDALGGNPGTLTLRLRATGDLPELPAPGDVAEPAASGDPNELAASGDPNELAASGGGAETIRIWQDDDGTAHAVSGTFDPAVPHVSLVVSDDGCGMDAELLNKVFSPFFTTKDRGAGTGLGLAATHSTVLAHGGALTVRSRIGQGTSFEVVLPQAATGTQPHPFPQGSDLPAQPAVTCRVLLVDDDPDFGDMVLAGLERRGIEVAPCADPLVALAGLQESPEAWDVLVTDQTMPGMTGLELIREVRQIRPDLPCILCTGFTEAQLDAAQLRDAGVFAKLHKPLDLNRLMAMLDQAVGAQGTSQG
ncbi:MAG: ATP-binding protein [Bacteroidales bacterium]